MGSPCGCPLTALNQVDDATLDWQIPGYRQELVQALVRTLPKDTRRALIPLTDTARAAAQRLGPPRGRLVDALAAAISEVSGVPVGGDDFDTGAVPPHLRMHVLVLDDDGKARDADTDLAAIRTRLATTAREAIADALPIDERTGLTTWDLGSLPQTVEAERAGHRVVGYPALLDNDESVSLRIVTNRDLQLRVMRGGVRRLLLLTAAPSVGDAARRLDESARLAIAASGISLADLAADCRFAAVDAVLDGAELPWDEARVCGAAGRGALTGWADRRGHTRRRRRCARGRPRRAPAARSPRVRVGRTLGGGRDCAPRPPHRTSLRDRRRRQPHRRRQALCRGDRLPTRSPRRGCWARCAPDERGRAVGAPLRRLRTVGSGGHARAPTPSRCAGCSRSCG